MRLGGSRQYGPPEGNFDDWVDLQSKQHPDGIPIKAQCELASLLCDEANCQPPSHDEHGKDPESCDSLVRWEGIRVEWFRDVFLRLPEIQSYLHFGCRMWFVRTAGLLEILRRRNIYSGTLLDHMHVLEKEVQLYQHNSGVSFVATTPPATGKATVFVSFTGYFSLELFASLLIGHLPGEYVWIDTFCVDQFAWTQRSDDEMLRFKTNFMNDLKDLIGQVGRTALMQDKWTTFMEPLRRIWVVWEMFCTVDANATLEVLLTEGERGRFMQQTLRKGDVLERTFEILETIDVRHATASNENDRKMIFRLLEEKQGPHNINRSVTRRLRQWLLDTAEEAYRDSDEGVGIVSGCNLAVLHNNFGNIFKARTLYDELIKTSTQVYGALHPTTLTCEHNRIPLLEARHEPHQVARAVYSKRRQVLGEWDLNTMSSLSFVARFTPDAEEQRSLYRILVAKGSELFGETNDYVLHWKEYLADSLLRQGMLQEAEIVTRNLVDNTRDVVGSRQYIYAQTSLVSMLMGERLAEAGDLCKQLYDASLEKFGSHNEIANVYGVILLYLGKATAAEEMFRSDLTPQRASSVLLNDLILRGNIALSICRQGRFSEAAELQRDLYELLVTRHGEQNTFTLVGLLNLAETKSELGEHEEAERLYRQALHGFGTTGQPWPYLYRTMRNLGSLLCDNGALVEAQMVLEEALERQQEIHAKHHQTVSTTFALALVYLRGNQWLKAMLLCSGVDQIVRNCYGPTHYRSKAAETVISVLGQQTTGNAPESLIRGLTTLRK